jgi:hypothetical protein
MRTAASAPALALLLFSVFAIPLSAADATGHWTGQITMAGSSTPVPFVLDLKADGQTLTGMLCWRDCTADKPQSIQRPTITGDSISFSATAPGIEPPQLNFYGLITGDTIVFILSGNAPQCLGFRCEVGEATASRAK